MAKFAPQGTGAGKGAIVAQALGGLAKDIYIVHGYTDLRYGENGLNAFLESLGCEQEDECLYLFCGKRADRIKLLYRSDGCNACFCLRQDPGPNPGQDLFRYYWPRQGKDVKNISLQTFHKVLKGERVASLFS